jgi:hypothetical protein
MPHRNIPLTLTKHSVLTQHQSSDTIAPTQGAPMKQILAATAQEQAASFAKAITRDEFGRFYWDERREIEVRRSLISAMARVKEERRARAKLAKQKK